jgi:hypothetical protein
MEVRGSDSSNGSYDPSRLRFAPARQLCLNYIFWLVSLYKYRNVTSEASDAKQVSCLSWLCLFYCPLFGRHFGCKQSRKHRPGWFCPCRPVRHIDLNNFLRRKARLPVYFSNPEVYIQFGGFPLQRQHPRANQSTVRMFPSRHARRCSDRANVSKRERERERIRKWSHWLRFYFPAAIRFRCLAEFPALAQEKKVAHVSKSRATVLLTNRTQFLFQSMNNLQFLQFTTIWFSLVRLCVRRRIATTGPHLFEAFFSVVSPLLQPASMERPCRYLSRFIRLFVHGCYAIMAMQRTHGWHQTTNNQSINIHSYPRPDRHIAELTTRRSL